MKKSMLLIILVFNLVVLNSCTAIGGIFKAGVWLGVIAVVIVGWIIYLITRKSNKS